MLPLNPRCPARSTGAFWLLIAALLLCESTDGSLFAAETAAVPPRREERKVVVDVPSDLAERSLRLFSQQSGLEVVFSSALTKGVRTAAVKGEIAPSEALDRMLRGTGLVVVEDIGAGAFSVRKETPEETKNEQRVAPRVPGDHPVPAPGRRLPTEEEVTREAVLLSPFEVIAENNGYYASNAMSGTRFNSKIEDLGASITVVTKQQLLDMAALDINDVFLYEANTEGTANFTALEVSRNGEVGDIAQDNPQSANRIRGVDSANIARGNYASSSRIPIDPYNSDGIEISRGPNSNIFGLGNAAGTVNIIPSRARLNQTATELTLRGDSDGGYRASLDINRPILKDRLAFRALALYDDKGFARKPSADITRRQQGMVTYRPFKSTTLRASIESYSNYARRPNTITPRDMVSYWQANGRPTWDPVTATVKLNGAVLGPYPNALTTLARDASPLPLSLLEMTGFHNRPSMFVDEGRIAFWMINNTSANDPTLVGGFTDNRYLGSSTEIHRRRSTTMPLFVTPGISDPSLYDWESVNFVSPNYSTEKARIANVEVEHFFLQTPEQVLAVQGGWFYEDMDGLRRSVINATSSYLYVDVNERLLDGRPNPYFRRPYIGSSEPATRRSTQINDTVRAQLVYQLDLSQRNSRWSWFGRNSISGYAETRRITTGEYRYREAVLDDHTWTNPANRANSGFSAGRAFFRYYVGDTNGQNIDYAPPPFYGVDGKYDLYWYNGRTGQWITEPATFGLAGYAPSFLTRQEIRTRGLVTQSSLLGDRLVVTMGWRTDGNRTRDSVGAVVDPATGLVEYSQMENWLGWVERDGNTSTRGAVLRPFRGLAALDREAGRGSGWRSTLAQAVRSLNFHYNQSDSFQPVPPQYSLFGELLPNPTGKGKDYGVSVSLFNGKLVAKVNRYETRQIDTPKGDTGTIATRVIRLDTGRGPGGRDSPPFNLEEYAWDIVSRRHGLGLTAVSIVRATTPAAAAAAAQYQTEVDEIMGVPKEFIENFVGRDIAETQDVTASGWEFELNYNPSRYWSVKGTGAQQEAVDSNVSPNIQKYIELRLPVWLSVQNELGASWWTSTNAANHFYNQVDGPLKTLTARQGKARSQVREWRFNLTTRYDLAGITEHRWLKNIMVGGGARWEDRASIGYLGGPADADGVIRSLDAFNPVYDSARTYVDLFASYRLKFGAKKYSARVQLNVRNAFESGRLQAVAVNPDGTAHTYRIIDPRQFILTTTFDL
ncbi:MAG: TonB-dependent receptor [Verrucomicrobiota bacterium]